MMHDGRLATEAWSCSAGSSPSAKSPKGPHYIARPAATLKSHPIPINSRPSSPHGDATDDSSLVNGCASVDLADLSAYLAQIAAEQASKASKEGTSEPKPQMVNGCVGLELDSLAPYHPAIKRPIKAQKAPKEGNIFSRAAKSMRKAFKSKK
jgi:hypothetical protein